MNLKSLQHRVWEIVEVAKRGDRESRAFDVFILTLIFLNVVAVVLGSMRIIVEEYGRLLAWFETFSVAVFSLEYLVRLWSCVQDPRFSRPVRGRLKFAGQPLPVIDLLAVLPFYLPLVGLDFRFLRVLRLMRLLRIAKLGRYSSSLRLIAQVVRGKREELIMSSCVMAMLLVLSSCLMFYCENEAQPKAFPDIPTAMWWSIVTLTTVGYGDVYPVTTLGRLLGAVIALLGIGMVALPTGILGAGFVEAVQKRKRPAQRCPHCGKEF